MCVNREMDKCSNRSSLVGQRGNTKPYIVNAPVPLYGRDT